MLSHDEDRSLRAIERYFEESDPAFSRMMRDHDAPHRSRQRFAAHVAVYLTGTVLFVMGAATAVAVLMVFGVLALTIGVCWHLVGQP